MLSSRPDIWRSIQELGIVLMLLGAFAPLPDPVGMSFTVLGAVIVLTYYVVTSREDHRERGADFVTVRGFLGWTVLPGLALGLLSLGTLAPISEPLDKALSWIAFAILLAWVGIPMWEYHRERDQHVKGG